jgi:hypothetical protein
VKVWGIALAGLQHTTLHLFFQQIIYYARRSETLGKMMGVALISMCVNSVNTVFSGTK